MKMRAVVCITIAAAGLVACDRVDVSTQWDPLLPLPLVQDESPAGIYLGTFTDTSGANPVIQPVTAIIDADGNIQILFATGAERHVAGLVDVSGDKLTGTLIEYFGSFTSFTGAAGIGELTVSGNVSTAVGITGEYVAETHAGTFVLDYQIAHGIPATLDLTGGVWSSSMSSSGGSIYTVTWDIADDGEFFGADTLGCVYFGRLSVADEFANAYGITLQVDSCDYFNGDYAGLAFLGVVAGPAPDLLTLGAANDVLAFSTTLQRQSPP